MKFRLVLLVAGIALAATAAPIIIWYAVRGQEKAEAEGIEVVMETTKGTIRLHLWPDRAPATVENFLEYVEQGHYDGTIFHRVIEDFMIQGGGFTPELEKKDTGEPIRNEASTELKNVRGTIAMARLTDPHSATAQFYINTADNPGLDHRDETDRGYGYAVFGKVIEGMEVVDAIEAVETEVRGGHKSVPVEPVIIKSVRRGGAE